MTTEDTMIADLHVVVDGREQTDRPPLVLLHGVGDRASSWDAVIAQLPADRTVVRYDLRGHGSSPAPEGPWTIDDFVADHLRLVTALDLPAADVVGFSLGGLIAQRVAATHPEVVHRLVLVGAVAGRTEAERRAVRDRLALVETEGPLGAAQRSVDRWYSAEFLAEHPDVRERTIERMASLDPVAYTHAYRVLATTDLVDHLGSITAPTLAVTGEFDVGSPPRMSQSIAEGVRDGRWSVIPDARHSVLVEDPVHVAKELMSHVG